MRGNCGILCAWIVVASALPSATPAGEVTAGPGNAPSVVRWEGGAVGTGSFVQDGTLVKTISVGSVSLAVSLRDTGLNMRADVLVANTGRHAFDVVPERFHLESIEPKRRALGLQTPEQVARSLEKRSELSAALFGPSDPSAVGSASGSLGGIQEVKDPSSRVDEVALRAATLKSGDNIFGAVFFERDRKIRSLVLRIPVENQVFEFPFSISAVN